MDVTPRTVPLSSAEAVALAAGAVRQIEGRLDLLLAHELPVCLGAFGDYGCSLGNAAYLYVETERPGQKHPPTNVLKYWPWLEEDPVRRLVLVHLFVANTHRRRLTAWVAERMKREFGPRFRYLPFEVPLTDSALGTIVAEVAAAAA